LAFPLTAVPSLRGPGQRGRAASELHRRRGLAAGIPPKDLPVENYDKIEFVLNLRTAREIGLTIPLSVRDFANRVIE
jgi:putative ABC transport system substrate-binding protein